MVLLLLERCKWVVEPAGAVPLAALLGGLVPGDDPVALVVSGGNVDPLLLTRLVEHGLTAAGRYLMVRVVLEDKPGALASLTSALGKLGLNLLTVEHRRSGAPVGVSEVEVILTLETRDPAIATRWSRPCRRRVSGRSRTAAELRSRSEQVVAGTVLCGRTTINGQNS